MWLNSALLIPYIFPTSFNTHTLSEVLLEPTESKRDTPCPFARDYLGGRLLGAWTFPYRSSVQLSDNITQSHDQQSLFSFCQSSNSVPSHRG